MIALSCYGLILALLGYGDGGVIRRIGTGEVPLSGELTGVVPFPQPLTFITVTFMLPLASTTLMKTCKKPMMVTGVVVPGPKVVTAVLS